VQADRQVTLEIGGNRLRVTTTDANSADILRTALAPHVVDGDALLGFKITGPESGGVNSDCAPDRADQTGLYVLIDCTGAVLARSRDRDAVLATLVSHIAALTVSHPQPPVSRLRLRALIASDHAVLAATPLFTRPPAIERRLVKLGYRMADVPFVDVDSESLMLQSFDVEWPSLPRLNDGLGHVRFSDLNRRVSHLFWPASHGVARASRALVCQTLASASVGVDRELRLSQAVRLADGISTVPVSPGDGAAAYEALLGCGG
jgi:hypothetical protein